MTRLLAALLIAGLVSPVRYGLVVKAAARDMARDWIADTTGRERGYCVAGPMSWGVSQLNDVGDSVWFVARVTPAVPIASGEDSIKIDCGPGVPTVHTHPCQGLVCDCNPSREDYAVLTGTGASFSVLQCSALAFVFFFPEKR